jgi:hypothetical protein
MGLVPLFADCDGSGLGSPAKTVLAIFILAALVGFAAFVIWVVRGAEPGARPGLLTVFVLGAAAGAAALVVRSGIGGENFFTPVAVFFVGSVVAGSLIGALARDLSPGRSAAVAGAGAILLPGLFVLLIIAAFGIGDACID